MIERLNLVDEYSDACDVINKSTLPEDIRKITLDETNKATTVIALCAIADALIDWRIKENEADKM